MDRKPIKRLGIVGGGLSALLLCQEAHKKGIQTTLLDPNVNCIGAEEATEHMVATFTKENMKKLSLRVDTMIFNVLLDYKLAERLAATTYPAIQDLNILSNPILLMEQLQQIGIPVIDTIEIPQDEYTLENLQTIEYPYNLFAVKNNYVENTLIMQAEDLSDFLVEQYTKDAKLFYRPVHRYTSLVTSIVMKKEGRVMQYDPIQEIYGENRQTRFSLPTTLTKTMTEKIKRYNRKIAKTLFEDGMYILKYGMNNNKAPELIHIGTHIPLAGALTMHAYNVSIYQNIIHQVLDLPIMVEDSYNPVEAIQSYGINIHEALAMPYHWYQLADATFVIRPIV